MKKLILLNLKSMLCKLYEKRNTRRETSIDPNYTRLRPEDSVVDGVLTRTSGFQKYNLADDFKEFTYMDFQIGNILAVGATNMLKPVTMANHDVASVAQAFDDLNTKLGNNETAE